MYQKFSFPTSKSFVVLPTFSFILTLSRQAMLSTNTDRRVETFTRSYSGIMWQLSKLHTEIPSGYKLNINSRELLPGCCMWRVWKDLLHYCILKKHVCNCVCVLKYKKFYEIFFFFLKSNYVPVSFGQQNFCVHLEETVDKAKRVVHTNNWGCGF